MQLQSHPITLHKTDRHRDREIIWLVLLLSTMISITSTFRKLRKKDITKFHVQFAAATTFMLVVFLAGFDRTESVAGCVTAGVLLHYFILVSWMWMAAEAVLMFKKLVIIFTIIRLKYIIIVSVICWGKGTLLHGFESRSIVYKKYYYQYTIFHCPQLFLLFL